MDYSTALRKQVRYSLSFLRKRGTNHELASQSMANCVFIETSNIFICYYWR